MRPRAGGRLTPQGPLLGMGGAGGARRSRQRRAIRGPPARRDLRGGLPEAPIGHRAARALFVGVSGATGAHSGAVASFAGMHLADRPIGGAPARGRNPEMWASASRSGSRRRAFLGPACRHVPHSRARARRARAARAAPAPRGAREGVPRRASGGSHRAVGGSGAAGAAHVASRHVLHFVFLCARRVRARRAARGTPPSRDRAPRRPRGSERVGAAREAPLGTRGRRLMLARTRVFSSGPCSGLASTPRQPWAPVRVGSRSNAPEGYSGAESIPEHGPKATTRRTGRRSWPSTLVPRAPPRSARLTRGRRAIALVLGGRRLRQPRGRREGREGVDAMWEGVLAA